ncbi:GATA transcription factor 5-like [Olea europaea var. sylvestris]|uniref:GATA transcription factor 5-like n=1 Tax=Olea europaea var. sylvestris TaxID=158386 RepID=UPI000C1D318D|nr:GATA transcription factor 5-like [Olea europaea var. sylvestris]
MLYRTHHNPFLSSFNTFSHSSNPNLLSCSPSLQDMDCAQGPLRSGFGPEMGLKSTPQTMLFDDFLAVNGAQSGVSGDDLFVDDLLDFSNGFSETEEEEPEKHEPEKHEQITVNDISHANNSASSVKEDFGTLPCSELSVPAEDLENLEWLSHFVEESFSEYSLTGKLPPNPTENQSEPEISVPEKPRFTTPVQTKARTKRTRTGVRIWPLGSPETSSSSSSSTSSTTLFPAPSPCLVYASPGQNQTAESFLGNLPFKKQKKKPTEPVGGVGAPRRCSHCGVTKTPQWRAGPLGAKTLCNACGVRYKSGRLLPEYRPACSPTFSSELHSNNHRKVLEMRQKKEVEAAPVSAPAVPSF